LGFLLRRILLTTFFLIIFNLIISNRKNDYPEIGDQLDALYHAGVFPANMAARIKETKDKYPK